MSLATVSSSRLHHLADNLEQFPERLGRFVFCRFVVRCADQLTQACRIGRGIGIDKCGQRIALGQKLVAPALSLMQPRRFRRVHAIKRIQLGLDRRGVYAAHQLANELLLSPQRAVLRDFATGRYRCTQLIRQFHAFELRGGKLHKKCAQILQRFYIALFLAAAGGTICIV